MKMIPFGGETRTYAGLMAVVVATLVAAPPQAFGQLQLTSIHSFNRSDGFGPMAGVVQGGDGALYGTTSQGGTSDQGTVFRLDPTTLNLTTLHHFAGLDGSVVYAGLTQGSDGLLYGSTYSGGDLGLGTLFRVGPDGQSFASLFNFSGTDGAKPDDLKLTLASDGSFYGATSEGGPTGGGTFFRLEPSTQVLTTLYSFNPTGGAGVDPGLVAGRDGVLYGTTYAGGTLGSGSIFRVDPVTWTPVTLHEFDGTDGAYPVPGSLMQGSDGNLYGTTQTGGGGYGTVFRLTPGTLAFTTLHRFGGVGDGRSPLGGLTEGADGLLYGTTVLGGSGYGTVFWVNPTTLSYGMVIRFGGSNGRMPSGNLVRANDGSLYGTTRVGGNFNDGTIFRLMPPDTLPPVITSVTANPNVLRPVNGKMVPVTVTVAAADAVDPAPKSRIISVSCNEPAAGDWLITGDLTVSLRAKRLGRADRIYTLTLQCTDASGNSASSTVNVTVPK